MSYRKEIPEVLFEDNTPLDNFVKVLDGVEEYKVGEIEKSARFLKTPLLSDLLWLRKKAEDYGYKNLPNNLVKEQLDALILNANDIMACKGSYEGLYLWLWSLTFGNITINSISFFPLPNYIQLSDLTYGFVSEINPVNNTTLYLFSGVGNFGSSVLDVVINTKYYLQPNLKEYIENHIKDHVGFLDINAVVTITLNNGVYNTSTHPYQYFVI